MYNVTLSIYKGLLDIIEKPKEVSIKVIYEDELDDNNKPSIVFYEGDMEVRRGKRHKRNTHIPF